MNEIFQDLDWLQESSVCGVVKWFDPRKGYGFIISDTDEEVFCHYSHIVGEGHRILTPGDAVEFEIAVTQRGVEARTIKTIDHSKRATLHSLNIIGRILTEMNTNMDLKYHPDQDPPFCVTLYQSWTPIMVENAVTGKAAVLSDAFKIARKKLKEADHAD